VTDPHRDEPVRSVGRKLEEASGAVILVHGRGASADDILGLAHALYHPDLAYLAPEAAGHTWYPYSFLSPIEQNEPWLSSALNKIAALIQQAISAGLPKQKIVVAGFSQGACLSTEFVARHPAGYGGLLAFTGGLIGPPGKKFNYTGSLEGMPAFVGCGDPDPHIPWTRVQESADVLKGLGAKVTMRRYPEMPHTISEEELELARPIVMALAAKSG
jgi:phospholipase/carboxylesterase